MQVELKRIQTEVGITFVHVTHDQEEAMTMADTVAVMNAGRVEQLGAPADLYERPSTTFVANFLGQSNLLPGRPGDLDGDRRLVDCAGHVLGVPVQRMPAGSEVLVGVRPEKIHLRPDGAPAEPGENRLDGGVVVDPSFSGVSTQYLVRLPDGRLVTVFAQNLGVGERFPAGTPVSLGWAVEHTFALVGDATAGAEADETASARPPDAVPGSDPAGGSAGNGDGATPVGVVAG
jgi:spermidine/putrescine transport system ATP-binding protein